MEILIRQVLQREHLEKLKTPFEKGFREKEKRMREKEEEMKKEMGLKWERERESEEEWDGEWGGERGEEESDDDDYYYGDEDEEWEEEEDQGERKLLAPGEIKIRLVFPLLIPFPLSFYSHFPFPIISLAILN